MTGEILNPFLESFIQFFPLALGTLLVFIIGWLISKWIGNIVTKFLNKIYFNQAMKGLGWEESLTKFNLKLDAPKFFGVLVRIFFTILFLMVYLEMVGLTQFSQFLEEIIKYSPNIFIACIIFIFTVFLVDFSQKVVIGNLEKEKITYSRFLGRIFRWSVWALTILAILYQLRIVPTLILSIFIGMIAMIVITLGVSFGLGGKDLAANILKELEDKFK